MKPLGNLLSDKFSKWSLRRKLVFLTLSVTTLGILLSMLGLSYHVHNIFKKSAILDLETLSQITRNHSKAALEFKDRSKAEEFLKETGSNSDIMEAGIYDAEGNLFAHFSPIKIQTIPQRITIENTVDYQTNEIKVLHPILLHGETIGGILLISNNKSYQDQKIQLAWICLFVFIGTLALMAFLAIKIQNWMTKPIASLLDVTKRVSQGDLKVRSSFLGTDEIGQLAKSFNDMIANLKEVHDSLEQQNRIKTEVAEYIKHYQGMTRLTFLTQKAISDISRITHAGHGAFYITKTKKGEKELVLLGSFAFKERKNVSSSYKFGEGLVGQCALEKEPILLTQVPPDYVQITSGLGEQRPLNILTHPIVYNNTVSGVLELASFSSFSQENQQIISDMASTLGVLINNIQDREKTKELLEDSQRLTEELQTQQEELKTSNEELEEQTRLLRSSEEKLKTQSEELQVNNEELEEKSRLLQKQKSTLEKTTADIQAAKDELETKAKEIQQASRYKSEFLANMSHELRTPLNSLLILAKLLADNDDGNLSSDQVESANVIYNSGKDLLNLINDILDLSKVEAGKLQIDARSVSLSDLIDNIRSVFNPIAKDKKLDFKVIEEPGIPNVIETDPGRTEQILKNLLSNAFKFTDAGKVLLRISHKTVPPEGSGLREKRPVIAFSIEDTGVGIPKKREEEIFQAFQQLDGSINRKYGGTGLGLTISRELAKLLGASIHLQSVEGKGSTFTLWMYVTSEKNKLNLAPPLTEAKNNGTPPNTIKDSIHPKSSILIIEDDENFASVLKKLIEAKGYHPLHTKKGEEGIALATKNQPLGIILDLGLPDMEGLAVMDSLRKNPDTVHIPIHVISGKDESNKAMEKGALGYLTKPIEKKDLEGIFQQFESSSNQKIHEVLLVEDDGKNMTAISKLLKEKNIHITSATSGEDALKAAREKDFEGIILDLGLPDMSGHNLIQELQKLKKGKAPSLIIYTGKALEKEEYTQLRKHTSRIIIKGSHSPERLKMEMQTFLNRVADVQKAEELPEKDRTFDPEKLLHGKKILLVDDDLRNNFALSKVLEKNGMRVVLADNGELGINKLKEEKDVDLILMDIMMPVMDGYQAIKQIRAQAEYNNLPILALTAKAMQEDRKKALEVGANDYLTKPVDTAQLINIIRLWVFR